MARPLLTHDGLPGVGLGTVDECVPEVREARSSVGETVGVMDAGGVTPKDNRLLAAAASERRHRELGAAAWQVAEAPTARQSHLVAPCAGDDVIGPIVIPEADHQQGGMLRRDCCGGPHLRSLIRPIGFFYSILFV